MTEQTQIETTATALDEEGVLQNGRRWRRAYLDNPIKRGDMTITSVQVMKPLGGDLRGASLTAVFALDVDALAIVLPRVTEPPIYKPDLFAMPGEDIASLGGEVVGFLLNSKARASVGLTE